MHNFRVPVRPVSSAPIETPSEKIEDTESLKPFSRLMSLRGNPMLITDFFNIIQEHGVLTTAEYRQLCDEITWTSHPCPATAFPELDVTATIGRRTRNCVASYTLVNYPLGYPRHSGVSPEEAPLMNRDWVACEYQSADSRRRTCHTTSQVSEALERIEDTQCELDVDIARSLSVLRYFLTTPPMAGYPSPIVEHELIHIYGQRGPVMLALLRDNPEVIHPLVLARLTERAVHLQVRKMQVQGPWSQELERTLPRQGPKLDLGRNSPQRPMQPTRFIGPPLHFPIDMTYTVTTLIDLYTTMLGIQSTGLGDRAREVVGALRRSGDLPPLSVTFAHATALCVSAAFVGAMECIRSFDRPQLQKPPIPVRCGLTKPNMTGSEKVLRVAVEAIYRKRPDEGAREIAALYPEVGCARGFDIIRLAALALTWMPAIGRVEREMETVSCFLSNGSVRLVSAYDPITTVLIDLNQVATILA
jgi:hypothetical protein